MPSQYLLSLAYVGTNYSGFQIQPELPTIQGAVWDALKTIDPYSPMPSGASRTDSGVHALDQKVLIEQPKQWDPIVLGKAVQAYLPHDIQIQSILEATPIFSLRKDVVGKRYRYQFAFGMIRNPFENVQRWWVKGIHQINEHKINSILKLLIGVHDLSSFRSAECVAASPIKTIHKIEVHPVPMGFDLVIEGDRFLMHQVRILAGTVLEIVKGNLSEVDLQNILGARDRKFAGATAPALGLVLEKIWLNPAYGYGDNLPTYWKS